MKLRIKGNTIRVRINNEEIQKLVTGKEVVDQTVFPSTVLTYLLLPSENGSVDFIDNKIKINLTHEEIKTLSVKNDKGVSKEFVTENDNKLSILVEQDLLG